MALQTIFLGFLNVINTTELIALVFAFSINIIALLIAWFKFRVAIRNTSNDLKSYNDVSIQKLNGMLTYFMHSADRPMWIKSVHHEGGRIVFRMLELNNQYCDLFGISRHDYIGKTDLEAGWDKKSADTFYEHDLKVWGTGNPETFSEVIDGDNMSFRKLLLQTPDGVKKGVMGYSINVVTKKPTSKLNFDK